MINTSRMEEEGEKKEGGISLSLTSVYSCSERFIHSGCVIFSQLCGSCSIYHNVKLKYQPVNHSLELFVCVAALGNN